jgi:phosphoribosylformylglycinamidine synthase
MDARLFGESASRIVISATPENAARIEAVAAKLGAPAQRLGTVGGDALSVHADGKELLALRVGEMEGVWRSAIRELVEQ